MNTTPNDHNPHTDAIRQYATTAVEIATTLNPHNPSWAGATTLTLNDPYLTDLLLTHIILTHTHHQAIQALQHLPPDPHNNRDMILTASYWLAGNTTQATTTGQHSTNRSAQLIAILAATGTPPHTWANTLVHHILHNTTPAHHNTEPTTHHDTEHNRQPPTKP